MRDMSIAFESMVCCMVKVLKREKAIIDGGIRKNVEKHGIFDDEEACPRQ
jgi:hypothetical protein